ncbi:unnamed protein product, partial [Discosporangium mesarthrocarpum]
MMVSGRRRTRLLAAAGEDVAGASPAWVRRGQADHLHDVKEDRILNPRFSLFGRITRRLRPRLSTQKEDLPYTPDMNHTADQALRQKRATIKTKIDSPSTPMGARLTPDELLKLKLKCAKLMTVARKSQGKPAISIEDILNIFPEISQEDLMVLINERDMDHGGWIEENNIRELAIVVFIRSLGRSL